MTHIFEEFTHTPTPCPAEKAGTRAMFVIDRGRRERPLTQLLKNVGVWQVLVSLCSWSRSTHTFWNFGRGSSAISSASREEAHLQRKRNKAGNINIAPKRETDRDREKTYPPKWRKWLPWLLIALCFQISLPRSVFWTHGFCLPFYLSQSEQAGVIYNHRGCHPGKGLEGTSG